jgi:hypothetical protein
MFEAADVDLFASTHTCLPALRRVPAASGREGCVVNNGADGMPNFAGDAGGLITRIATTPSPHPVLQELRNATDGLGHAVLDDRPHPHHQTRPRKP